MHPYRPASEPEEHPLKDQFPLVLQLLDAMHAKLPHSVLRRLAEQLSSVAIMEVAHVHDLSVAETVGMLMIRLSSQDSALGYLTSLFVKQSRLQEE